MRRPDARGGWASWSGSGNASPRCKFVSAPPGTDAMSPPSLTNHARATFNKTQNMSVGAGDGAGSRGPRATLRQYQKSTRPTAAQLVAELGACHVRE